MKSKKLESKRISIRLDSFSKLKLDELTEALGVTYNLLIRTIIFDFLTRNEDSILNIIDRHKVNNNTDIMDKNTDE